MPPLAPDRGRTIAGRAGSVGPAIHANGPAAYAAATELPRVELADALALTLLMASEDRTMFERACVRWVGRLSLEVPGLPPEGTQLALASLSLLARGSAAGAHALAELFDELGRSDLAEVTERWLRRRS